MSITGLLTSENMLKCSGKSLPSSELLFVLMLRVESALCVKGVKINNRGSSREKYFSAIKQTNNNNNKKDDLVSNFEMLLCSFLLKSWSNKNYKKECKFTCMVGSF